MDSGLRDGLETSNIEVRYENLTVEGDAYVGDKALPSLYNATFNSIQKRNVNILQCISGIIKPSRMTLLLGPPGAGKTTLLLALAGKLDQDLNVSGNVTYRSRQLSEFIPQRSCAYISPNNLHTGEMTVRETLDFSGRCLGVGSRYKLLSEISKMEKEERNAFPNVTARPGTETNLITDYVLKDAIDSLNKGEILGLESCADTMVGDQMRRGISGEEKKRVTIVNMIGNFLLRKDTPLVLPREGSLAIGLQCKSKYWLNVAPYGAIDIWSLWAFPSVGLGPVAYRMVPARGPDDVIRHHLWVTWPVPSHRFLADVTFYQLSVIGAAKVSHFEIMCRVLGHVPT
ncbi:ABC transporter G family member 39-like protein isoform X2, partial [Tanacetum coccineum]